MLTDVTDKDQWIAILDYVSRDTFWCKVMDFDKLYRKDNYMNFLEKSDSNICTNENILNLFEGEGHHVN